MVTAINIKTPVIAPKPARIEPSIIGFNLVFIVFLTGIHNNCIEALCIVNLKTWSENLDRKTVASIGLIKNPIDPNISDIGKIKIAISTPNRDKTLLVIYKSINILAIPLMA